MGSKRHRAHTLFLVRVWPEEASGGAVEWCGNVRRVVGGEAYSFRDWPSLISLLAGLVSGEQGTQPRNEASHGQTEDQSFAGAGNGSETEREI